MFPKVTGRAIFRNTLFLFIMIVLFALVLQVKSLDGDRDTMSRMVAAACDSSSLAELEEAGLLAECQLARRDKLVDELPDADAEEIADGEAIPDSEAPDPTVDSALLRQYVADYFEDNPLPDPQYEQRVERAVAQYLRANPPAPGRPPTEREIRAAVKAVVLANPPADGTDGVGVVNAVLTDDGCSVTFTYTSGGSDTVGPLCGADGEPGPAPTPEQIAAGFEAYCAANGDCRGPAGPSGIVVAEDACTPPEGDVVSDVGVEYLPESQTVRVTCETITPTLPGVP